MTSNGEVEGPHDHVGQTRRARNIDWVPPRQSDHASRTPPTIVRAHSMYAQVPSEVVMTLACRATSCHDPPAARQMFVYRRRT